MAEIDGVILAVTGFIACICWFIYFWLRIFDEVKRRF